MLLSTANEYDTLVFQYIYLSSENMHSPVKIIATLFLTTYILCGCAGEPLPNKNELLQSDIEAIFGDEKNARSKIIIDIEKAISLGLEQNLDLNIATQNSIVALNDTKLQKLNALPTITAKLDYIRRSNPGASSSVSALTGTQSLEPSISTDQERNIALVEANWSLLDSAINIYRSKSAEDRALIALERERKVRQNVTMDVYMAFWRAATAQEMKSSIQKNMSQAKAILRETKNIRKNGDIGLEQIEGIEIDITRKMQRLNNASQNLFVSKNELKALLSIPPSTDLILDYDSKFLKTTKIPSPKKDINVYVNQALENRPEINEEFLTAKISSRAVNETVLESFPGLSLIFGYNDDTNSFLQEEQWATFTASISQSITRLLTLPSRYERAKNDQALADYKRQALIAAVMSQVFITKFLFESDLDSYELQKNIYDSSSMKRNRLAEFEKNGLIGNFESISSRLDYDIAKLETYQAFIKAQNSYARFVNSIGLDEDFYMNKNNGHI